MYKNVKACDDSKQANVNLAGDRRRSNTNDNHARHSYRRTSNSGNQSIQHRTAIFALRLNVSDVSLNSAIDKDVARREKNVSNYRAEYDGHPVMKHQNERRSRREPQSTSTCKRDKEKDGTLRGEDDRGGYMDGKRGSGTRKERLRGKSRLFVTFAISVVAILVSLRPKSSRQRQSSAPRQ